MKKILLTGMLLLLSFCGVQAQITAPSSVQYIVVVDSSDQIQGLFRMDSLLNWMGDSSRIAAADSSSAAKIYADGLYALAKAYADTASGDSAQAVLLIARGDMSDSSIVYLGYAKTAIGDTATVLRTFAKGAAGDSARAVLAIALAAAGDSALATAELDSFPLANKTGDGLFIKGTAKEITQPGYFYTIGSDGKYTKAGTAVTVEAIGVAMDSVAAGAVCRFLFYGTFRNDDWNFSFNSPIFNDTLAAGAIDTTVRAVPKKQQKYGRAIAPSVIFINIDGTITY